MRTRWDGISGSSCPRRTQERTSSIVGSMEPIEVTVWNEYIHERRDEPVRAIYPEGIHGAIAAGIAPLGPFEIRTATLEEPEHGLPQAVLDSTDVLLWWGHTAHDQVSD